MQMPDNDRISPLLSALSGGLSQEKLELLGREFNSLAQDRAETLVFFVLQNVCQHLASALEGEAVSVERFQALTAGIADQIAKICATCKKETRMLQSSKLWSSRFLEI